MRYLILLLALLGCDPTDKVIPPEMPNRLEIIDGKYYDTYLHIYCRDSKTRYVLNPPRCLPGEGEFIYSDNNCKYPDSVIPTDFLENNPKYVMSLGFLFSLESNPKLKGPGLYEINTGYCVPVLGNISTFDLKEQVSYQIFADIKGE